MERQRIILIADDTYDILKSVRPFFIAENYTVLEADNGKIALELILTRTTIDCLLIDNEMPEMFGIEVLKIMHEKQLTNRIRTALWSGNSNKELKRDVKLYGAKYFEKPPLRSLASLIEYFKP